MLLNDLWRDDTGAVLSSELVLVGTLGVVGATVGLNAISTAVNEELEDVAFAIRSLDQSYEIRGVKGCGAWTAGSVFHQEPVKESLRELDAQIDRDEAKIQQKLKNAEQEEQRSEAEKKPEMKRPDANKTPPKKTPPKKKRPKKNEREEEVIL